jgi:hypothetical protein
MLLKMTRGTICTEASLLMTSEENKTATAKILKNRFYF